jgi:hypothetical protein
MKNKNYSVSILSSDNVYKVTVKYNRYTMPTLIETFPSKERAIEQAQWYTNGSYEKNSVQSVEVSHVLRYVVAE